MKGTERKKGPDPDKTETLQTILNCVADGVFTIDPNKKIQFFNKAAERITGFTAKEALGKYCFDVFQTSTCGSRCVLDEVVRIGEPIVNRPVTILTRDGRSIVVSISAAALRNAAGNVIGGVETFRDLTTEEQLRREITKSYSFHDIISRHPKMHDIFAILPDVAESGVPVLLEGESGTGKELFARALHNLSSRKKNPFVAVNCASLPDTLLESELFGYKKGAFTDARQDKPGRFDLAKGGTLLLDEIGDVSPALQVRLLRVLQEKTYEPLGGTEPVHADVRIIAATNQRLLDKLREGTLREDLYYRLNVLRLELPPLRERRCDIPLLVEHFLQKYNAQSGKSIEGVDDNVLQLLMDYDFPGNIRELENAVQHAFVLCKGPVIRKEDLPRNLLKQLTPREGDAKLASLKDIEKRAILNALEQHAGNRAATARQLGINPSTLYRKMKRYGLLK